MYKRWLGRFALAAALGLVSTSAFAQNGKVKKAEKMLIKYHSASDQVALAKARDAISDAKVHSKTRDLAHTWFVVAEVNKAYALDPDSDSPTPTPGQDAIKAYSTALEKGGSDDEKEAILEGVTTLESLQQAKATEAFESKTYEDAWPALQTVLAAQKIIRQVGRLDPARERTALQLAILTSVKLNDLKGAKVLHEELHTSHGVPSATSLALATAISEDEGPEAALKFLAPLSDVNPDDAELMRARFDHLFSLDRKDDVIGLLVANESSVGKALTITLLHATAWDRAEDLAKSADAYANAMALGPEDQTVLRGYADVEMRRASAFDLAASSTRKWRERKAFRLERDEARQRAMELLRASRTHDPEHLPTLELLREVYDDIRLPDREEISSLEQAIEDLKAKAAPE